MTVIVDGTNGLTFPNTTQQASAGVVLQFASNTYSVASGTISTSSSSVYTDILTVSITPKSSTSKILLSFTGTFNCPVNGVPFCAFDRNGTTLNVDAMGGFYYGAASNISILGQTFQYYDSPATTSAITYKFKFKSQSSGTTVTFNSNWGSSSGLAAIITAMEIN